MFFDSIKKWRNRARKAVACIMPAVFGVALLSGCGSYEEEPPIEITVYSQLSTYSGLQTGWAADMLLEKFNVKLIIVSDTDTSDVYEKRMKNGNLGDIVVWSSSGSQYTDAIEAGMLYDWNSNNLLELYGGYINTNLKDALEKNASIKPEGSTDFSSIYGVGSGMVDSSSTHYPFTLTWDVRWDIYSQLKNINVNKLDDYVKVLSEMKVLCPVDDNGEETYGVYIWSDWDYSMVTYVKATASAYYGYDELGIGLYNPDNGEFYDCLMINKDGSYGPYLEMLNFYNKLYRAGLVDPASRGGSYAEMEDKLAAGGILFSIYNYTGSEEFNTRENVSSKREMYPLIPADATPIAYGMSTVGNDCIWSIGSKTKHPELCMQIINYLFSPEGRLSTEYGPKEVNWNYDDNGYLYLTDSGYECLVNENFVLDYKNNKVSFAEGRLQINNDTLALNAINTDSRRYERYNYKFWNSYNAYSSSQLEKSWKDYTGSNSVERYIENNGYRLSPASSYVIGTRDAALQSKWDSTTAWIISKSWDAIYADSEDEFRTIVNDMLEEAKGSDYKACVSWCKDEASKRYECETKQ